MFSTPPDVTREGFGRLIEQVIDRLGPDPPRVGGSRPAMRGHGEPIELLQSAARMLFILEGHDCNILSVRGRRAEAHLEPGQCMYVCPRAWTIHLFHTPFEAFGAVFWPRSVRLIQVVIRQADTDRQQPKEGTPWAYHTAGPLLDPGQHILGALNSLAEAGAELPEGRDLIVGLLKVIRRQLASDEPARHSEHRAVRTWLNVEAYIAEHFGRGVSRDSVAAALGLHPNYLSALARHAAGQSFRHVLENVRMMHARQLLAESDVKLARIATLCGYANANRFSTVFSRSVGITPSRYRNTTTGRSGDGPG